MSIVENSQEIQDLNLSPIKRTKFRIDGDNTRILELNTTDMGVITRLDEFYPKLQELEHKYADVKVIFDEDGNITDESTKEVGEALKDIDKEMRDCIDYIFDSNVSEVCAPSGTMLDPINGAYRFEYILDALSSLYASEIEANIKKRKETMGKHTAKYTKSRSRKK